MKNVTVINLNHKDIVTNLFNQIYDLVDEDPETFYYSLLTRTTDNESVKSLFDGFAPTLIGDRIKEIEELDTNNEPYVIVIWKDDTIWGTVSCEEVNY